MRRFASHTLGKVGVFGFLVLSSPASAVIVPFVEGFDADAANWFNSGGTAEVGWVSSGGPDGSAYVSTTFNFVSTSSGATPALFRAQDEFDSSGGAFVGDWAASDVQRLNLLVRHDAGMDLTFFVRFAAPLNFPGGVSLSGAPVPSGSWRSLQIPLPDSNMVFEGPFDHASLFANIGHVQVGVLAPESLIGVDQAVTFDLDRVAIVGNIPAVSEWGMAVLVLLTMTAGTLTLRRRCSS